MLEREGRLPDTLVACIGGGSNAMGLFHDFLDDRQIAIYGSRRAGMAWRCPMATPPR
jgi:tryptophan synthase beta chain